MVRAILFDCFGVVLGEGLWSIFVRAGGDLERDKAFLDDIVGSESLNKTLSVLISGWQTI